MLIFLTYLGISLEYTIKLYLYSIPFGILLLLTCYHLSYDTNIATLLIYLIFYYLRLRSDILQQKLMNLNEMSNRDLDHCYTHRLVRGLIVGHNGICTQIKTYNRFWSIYFLVLLFVIIPMNLLFLNQVVFTKMQFIPFLLNCFIVLISWLFVFFVIYCASRIPSSMASTAKQLFKLQMTIDKSRRTKRLYVKLIAMSCYERMDNSSVGFTVGTLFTMTNTALFKVSFRANCFLA